MKNNLRALGLTLVAMAAISALVANGALGAEFKSSSANLKTSITATNHESKSKLSIGEAVVECNGTHLQGTMVGAVAPSITLTLTSTGCTFGGVAAEVRWNHCALIFKAETVETGGTGQKHGDVDYECSGGSQVEIVTAGFCTVKIGAQTTPLDGAVYTNVKTSTKEEITAHITLKNIKIASKEGPFCFLIGSEAEQTVTGTFKGYEDLGSPASGTETTTPPTVKEGAQVDFTKI